MLSQKTIAPLALLLALAFAAPARATVVLEVGLEEMTHASDLVLHGVVAKTDVVAVGGVPGHLVTDVTFRLVEVWKGERLAPDELFTLRLPGGTRGGLTLRVPGVPSFGVGNEVVLFLERTSGGFTPTGLTQGVFSVEIGRGGEKLVSRRVGGVGVARLDSGVFRMAEAPADVDGLPLRALRDEVMLYIEGGGR
jgi:hypothetical protein